MEKCNIAIDFIELVLVLFCFRSSLITLLETDIQSVGKNHVTFSPTSVKLWCLTSLTSVKILSTESKGDVIKMEH